MDYRDLIKRHEGFRVYVYLDTEGFPTVGWGHCFHEDPKPRPGTLFTQAKCEDLFDEDMQVVERNYVFLEDEFKLRKIGPVRRAVLKNMLFNLGLSGLLRFKKMWKHVVAKNWNRAAIEMIDSRWAKQVKRRAKELARMMETNEWPTV